METKKTDKNIKTRDRRDFLLKAFSSCALCCLAAPELMASDSDPDPLHADDKHKFSKDSGMSHQDVYDFSFKEWYIPVMKNLKDQIGHDRFLEMLIKSSEDLHKSSDSGEVDYKENTLAAFANNIKESLESDRWKDILTPEIIRADDEVFELKFTECLWAKTFREENASDIGYAGVCYQDYEMARSFNPKMYLVREKTLMQGHDCCHFKWKMQG